MLVFLNSTAVSGKRKAENRAGEVISAVQVTGMSSYSFGGGRVTGTRAPQDFWCLKRTVNESVAIKTE